MLSNSTSTKARRSHQATAPNDDKAESARPRTAVRRTGGHLALTSEVISLFGGFGKAPQIERYSMQESASKNSDWRCE